MRRHFIRFADGTELFSATQGNAIASVRLTACVNNNQKQLMLGTVCASVLEVSLFAPSGALELSEGQELTLYEVDDAGEKKALGVFVLSQVLRPTADTVKFVAYDRIVYLDKDLSVWLSKLTKWPYRLKDFALMVCDACGVSLSVQDIPNADFPIAQFSVNASAREIMQWIAQACGSFCVANAEGVLELRRYTPKDICLKPEDYFHNGLNCGMQEVAKIDGVQVQLGSGRQRTLWPEMAEGANCYVIEDNPILCANIGQPLRAALQVIGNYIPYGYRPCRVELPALCAVDVGDIICITDKNGVLFSACVMTKIHDGQRDVLISNGKVRMDSPDWESTNNAGQLQKIAFAIKNADGDKVMSLINLSESGVQIRGQKIRLEGTVTANNYFKILSDGSAVMKNADISGKVNASEGKIAGWNLSDYGFYIDADDGREETYIGNDGTFRFVADDNASVCFLPDANGFYTLWIGSGSALKIGDTVLTETKLKKLLALLEE